jgi:O-antigen ligase
MVLIILTEENPFIAVRALLRRLYLLHIPLSALTIKYFRNIGVVYAWNGIEEMWVGLCVHKNNLGQVAMCSGLFSFWQVLDRWRAKKLTADLMLFAITVWILRGSKNSHSSTAIVSCVLGMAMALVLQYARKRLRQAKRAFLSAILAILLIAPAVTLVCEALDTTPLQVVLTATGRDMTLTGRTGLWLDLLDNASKSPAVGTGFGAFWVGEAGYSMYPLERWSIVTPEWRPNEGHNGYIDVYVELGACGILLMAIVIAVAVSGAVNQLEHNFSFASLRLVILTGVLINNVTESSLLNGTHSLWFLFLIAGVQLPRIGRTDEVTLKALTADDLPDPVEEPAMFSQFGAPVNERRPHVRDHWTDQSIRVNL